MKPYYQDKWVTIYHGDCREVLSQLEVNSGLILTDPPYNVGKDYGNGSKADRRPDYLQWLNDIWVASARVVEEGNFLIFTNTTQFIPSGMVSPLPWRYLHLACWNKPLSLRPAFYGICPHWEPIFIYYKGEKPWRPFRNRQVFNDVVNANVVYDKTGNKKHPTPKPLELYLPIIPFFTPPTGIVLDLFIGTGTVLAAAKLLGYKSIGIDNNKKYCEIAARRCSQEVMELKV